MTTKIRRRDGTLFDAAPEYTLQDGESYNRPVMFIDTAAVLTDTQLRDMVGAALRPKDVSRLSAPQLKRAFVAMKLGGTADEMLSKSDSFIEGAFHALTNGGNDTHLVNVGVVERREDGTVRDSAEIVRDGFTITDTHAKGQGYSSAADMVQAHDARAGAYEVASASLSNAWKVGTGHEGTV